MESNDSGSLFFPFQQDHDDLPIITHPELATIWDVGFDHISYPGPSQEAEVVDLGDDGKAEIEEKAANQVVKKKILHRDIERQRRQEMATLYASLRSVLPPQHIKGKRSTSDQIDEAAKYIRCLQNKIRELGNKRDSLTKPRKNEFLGSEKGSSSKILPVAVTVQPCSVGVEVLISCEPMVEGLILPLSRILQLLLEEGLVVVCCNFTKFDGRLNYMIQSEVLVNPGVNLQMLQRKLTCMVNLHSN